MTDIKLTKAPFHIHNPFKPYFHFQTSAHKTYIGLITDFCPKDDLLAMADRITEWGKVLLIRNMEKRIEFTEHAAHFLDWSTFAFITSLEVTLVADQFFKFGSYIEWIYHHIPEILHITHTPARILGGALNIVEMGIEFISLRRSQRFHRAFKSMENDPNMQIKWLKETYFTLNEPEGAKIKDYIDQTMPQLTGYEKAERFERIAEKALRVKFDALGRRISKHLSHELIEKIEPISREMNSWWPQTRAKGIEKAQVLMQSIEEHAKWKTVVHALAIVAISISLVGLVLGFAALPLGAGLMAIEGLSALIFILSFIADKVVLKRELKKMGTQLDQLNLIVEAPKALLSSNRVAV